jgi:hypothetical protein
LAPGGDVVVEVQASLVFPVFSVQVHPAAEGGPVNVSPVGRVAVRVGADVAPPAVFVNEPVRVRE